MAIAGLFKINASYLCPVSPINSFVKTIDGQVFASSPKEAEDLFKSYLSADEHTGLELADNYPTLKIYQGNKCVRFNGVDA